LLKKVDALKKFKVLIVVAGFEGALPTVVGGLLKQPIIAVPTSIGYGVAEGGNVALNTMLSSCANGIMVVNIDNGYGAAMGAFRILNLVRNKR
jgi:NCAIR mutase (PurE)-related protein